MAKQRKRSSIKRPTKRQAVVRCMTCAAGEACALHPLGYWAKRERQLQRENLEDIPDVEDMEDESDDVNRLELERLEKENEENRATLREARAEIDRLEEALQRSNAARLRGQENESELEDEHYRESYMAVNKTQVRKTNLDFIADYQVGDWVRFWDGFAMKVGQIQYVISDGISGVRMFTDAGTVTTREVLERRGS